MRFASGFVLAALLLAGCGDDDDGAEIEPSAACLDAMVIASNEPDPAAANPLIVDTLSACSSAEEWLAALRQHPAAMGLTPRAEIGEIDIRSACMDPDVADTPVCQDAAAQRE